MLSRPQVVLVVLALLAFVAVFAVSAPILKGVFALATVFGLYFAFRGDAG